MSFVKRNYIDYETVITAENLNDIQDELISHGEQQDATMIENSASGTIASFSDGANLPVSELLVGIEAVQDLHGYDHPWVGGAGKNKAELVDPQLTTNVAQRVATLNYTGTFDITISFDLVGAKYTASGASLFNFVYNGDSHYVVPTSIWKIDNSTTIQLNTEYTGRFYYKWTNVENPAYINMYFESATYGKWSGQMKNIQVEIGARTDYEPYENICSISGWTEANVVVSPTLDAQDGTTYPVSWQTEAGTVYGGTLDVTTGVLTVTHGYIASYNNETLPSKWISDRDVYASGTTPTTGAEVVYELATSQTVQLTPTEVLTILGENNIFADCGDIENVTYRADTKLYIDNAIGGVDELLGSGVIE